MLMTSSLVSQIVYIGLPVRFSRFDRMWSSGHAHISRVTTKRCKGTFSARPTPRMSYSARDVLKDYLFFILVLDRLQVLPISKSEPLLAHHLPVRLVLFR